MVTNAEGTQFLPDTGSSMDTASPYGEGTYSSPFDLTAVGNSICFMETVTYTEPEETPPFNTAQKVSNSGPVTGLRRAPRTSPLSKE